MTEIDGDRESKPGQKVGSEKDSGSMMCGGGNLMMKSVPSCEKVVSVSDEPGPGGGILQEGANDRAGEGGVDAADGGHKPRGSSSPLKSRNLDSASQNRR